MILCYRRTVILRLTNKTLFSQCPVSCVGLGQLSLVHLYDIFTRFHSIGLADYEPLGCTGN